MLVLIKKEINGKPTDGKTHFFYGAVTKMFDEHEKHLGKKSTIQETFSRKKEDFFENDYCIIYKGDKR